jgi:hypothetical protein
MSCPLRDKCAPQQARPEWRRSITRLQEPSATTAFKQKMATEEAKQIYARRSQIAEFPHAWIKQRCGLRQFRCRGRLKVAMEATWACLSYNLTRWFGLKRTPQVRRMSTIIDSLSRTNVYLLAAGTISLGPAGSPKCILSEMPVSQRCGLRLGSKSEVIDPVLAKRALS